LGLRPLFETFARICILGPKNLTQQNPHLGEQALQQQFMAGFDGRQHPFSDPNGNPGMQVPPKPVLYVPYYFWVCGLFLKLLHVFAF
jgi:hypothetical protein